MRVRSNISYAIQRFVDDVIVLGILHVHARQTYHLQEHPRVARITNTTIYPLPPHSIHGCHTPPINILNVLSIDQTSIDTILWDTLTHKMLSIPIPHGDHHFHPLIEPTTTTKIEGLTSQVNKKIIVTRFKIMLYRTDSALYQAI